MSCFICRRANCIPSFHSLEEQQAYEKAEEAYDNFNEVWEECRAEWTYQEEQGDD